MFMCVLEQILPLLWALQYFKKKRLLRLITITVLHNSADLHFSCIIPIFLSRFNPPLFASRSYMTSFDSAHSRYVLFSRRDLFLFHFPALKISRFFFFLTISLQKWLVYQMQSNREGIIFVICSCCSLLWRRLITASSQLVIKKGNY